MSGPYVSDDGEVWVERGTVPWPKAWTEARDALDLISDDDVLRYDGIDHCVLVSDEEEAACEQAREDFAAERAPSCKCCRVIDAYHFHGEER